MGFLQRKYCDAAEFVATAAPPNVAMYRKKHGVRTLAQCVQVARTNISDAVQAWGDELTAITVIKIYLVELNKCLNIARMEPWQINDCADLLLPMVRDMSVFEIHEFFCRCKTAQYGEYYGSLDVMKISSDLIAFRKDLTEARQFVEKERRRQHERIKYETIQKEHIERIATGELYKVDMEAIIGPEPLDIPVPERKYNSISTRLKEQGIL